MPILALFAPLLSFLIRAGIAKFMALAAIFGVMALIVPFAITLVLPYVGGTSLTSAFSGLNGGVWFFLDFFALDYGLPLILSAFVTRFLIRRLPIIG
jgi:hypothetical protein